MPITDLWSYPITGQEFETHWVDVNDNRTANMLAELLFPDGYGVGSLTMDIAAISSANTDVEDLDNAFDLAATPRDTLKRSLRERLIEFREAVAYWLPDSGYERALPKTFRPKASVQKTLKPLDDMASLWPRIDAETGVPNFMPPLVMRGSYNVATFTADVATLRTRYKAVTEAANDLRLARKQRDALLDPFRARLVQYREAVQVAYGDEHPFTLSLPDVYRGGGSSPPTLPALPYNLAQIDPSTVEVWIQMIAGVGQGHTLVLRHNGSEFQTAVGSAPGEFFKTPWPGVNIPGDIDEVILRDNQGNDVARGERDTELPDPEA